jgi:ABC-type multidrug transport system fused ATPase/permease subunit
VSDLMRLPTDLLSFTPLLGLLIPLVIRFVEKQNKLQRSRRLIDLLKTRDELKQLLAEKIENQSATQVVVRRVNDLIAEIEKEIFAPPRETKIKYYIVLISIEVVTFISAIYFGILVFMNKVINGKSYESNLPFLEGIFANPVARVMMLMLFVTLSIFLTMRVASHLEPRARNKYRFNFMMLLVFNVLFIAITLASSLLLYLIDFVNPWF